MADLLPLTPDQLLTTTRSVRKRLDLTLPVPREVVMECLDIALQAPSGSNRQSWAFVAVDDPDKKRALAEIYGSVFDEYMQNPASANYQEGDTRAERRDAVSDSARYLRAHLHEVPVHLLAYAEGRPDGAKVAGQAGYWGSILPAVWSFMLAARARGLGSVWTTMTCRKEEEVAAVVGIDASRYSHAGLFPVAYTIGTDFKPAPRLPLDQVVRWNTFA
jgi:nitroreductase